MFILFHLHRRRPSQKDRHLSRSRHQKQKGFTLIEMLVVVAIISFVAVSLGSITRALTTSSLRLNNLQTVRSQAQAAELGLSKQIRMSELTGWNTDSATFNWRKESSTGQDYAEQNLTLNQATIQSYFPNFEIVDFKIVNAGGTNGMNRLTLIFKIKIKNSPEDILVPFQITVSLRSYEIT